MNRSGARGGAGLPGETQLYLQLLVGLIDREGREFGRDDVVTLAREHGFDLSIFDQPGDPALSHGTLVSDELLGVWSGRAEPSVLLLRFLPFADSARFEAETGVFRDFVDRVLNELNQDAVLWVPAYKRADEHDFHLLKMGAVRNADEIEFPDVDYVFGRQVNKTLALIRGPERDGEPSFLVYEPKDWPRGPLFVPNVVWIPQHEIAPGDELLLREVKSRYPCVENSQLELIDTQEGSFEKKGTGDEMKAIKWGEIVVYRLDLAFIRSPELEEKDPDAEFIGAKGQPCFFRSVQELLSHTATQAQNADVLRLLQRCSWPPEWTGGV